MTQPEAARVERGPITEVKRFALGMADLLERQGFTIAAAELRRLHAQRDALLEALKQIEPILARMYGPQAAELPPMQIVRAAIAKAEAA
jgi:hypothetical protein